MKKLSTDFGHFWNNPEIIKIFGEDSASSEVLDFLNNHNKAGGRILDIGCGGGRNTVKMAELGYETFAVDLYKGMVEFTKNNLVKNNLKATIRQAKMTSLPFPDNYFDYLVSNGVFHQATTLSEYIKAVNEAARVIRKNGYLYSNIFILNDNIVDNYEIIDPNDYSFITEDKMVTSFLPKKLFFNLMKSSGFVLQETIEEKNIKVTTGNRTVLKAIFKKN